MSKNKEEKYTLTIRMDDEIKQEIQVRMDDARVRSLNAFVLKAIEFYLGYLRQGKNLNYISPILASSIKGEMKIIEHNLSEIIFKMAVQLSMLTQIVADEKEFYPEYLDELQKWCAEKVALTNGIIIVKVMWYCVVLKKGCGNMAKRRPNGDGMVRKRGDGRWEGRIVVGHKNNGKPIYRYVLAKTQKELTEKLHTLKH